MFTDLGKAKRKRENIELQRKDEEKLRKAMDEFREKTSENVAKSVSDLNMGLSSDVIRAAVSDSINKNCFELGLKSVVDSQKKKVLISQTYDDKSFSDIIYKMLLHNNVSAEDILYTNCDDEVCRVPEGTEVYEYLRDFFVESYSTQKIYVLFVTSENTKQSWGAITEVGAAWITQIDHKIFNIHPFRPEHPLNDELQWQNTNRDNPTSGDLWMVRMNADILCQKIESVCDALGYKKKARDDNMNYLETLVSVRAT